MELLRKSLVIITVILTSYSFAQDSKVLQTAFAKSYAYEAKYQYDEAIQVLKDVYSDKAYSINMRMGWLCYLDKNYASSINYYKKSIDLMPASAEALWAILSPQIASEKWADVDVALNLYPLDYNNLLMSAWTNYFLGKTNEAKVLFNRVLLLYQGDASAIEGLGLIK